MLVLWMRYLRLCLLHCYVIEDHCSCHRSPPLTHMVLVPKLQSMASMVQGTIC